MILRLFFVLSSVTVLLFNHCHGTTEYENLSTNQFEHKIASKDVQLLDVRTPSEFEGGHIAGAMLANIKDSAAFVEIMNKLDGNKAVAVYCRSGVRSAKAASILSANGFRVFNLENGFNQWQKDEKPIVVP